MVDYYWTRLDKLVTSDAGTVTPYGIPRKAVKQRSPATFAAGDPAIGAPVEIDLQSSGNYSTFVAKRFYKDDPLYTWIPIPTDVSSQITKDTTLRRLCDLLIALPGGAFPARFYDWKLLKSLDKKDTGYDDVTIPIANMLVDYWDNSKYRSAVMNVWPCDATQTVVGKRETGSCDNVPVIVDDDHKLTHVIALKAKLQELTLPGGGADKSGSKTVVFVSEDDIRYLENTAIELRSAALRVITAIGQRAEVMRERMKLVGQLDALSTFVTTCVDSDDEDAERADLKKLAQEHAATARTLALDSPIAESPHVTDPTEREWLRLADDIPTAIDDGFLRVITLAFHDRTFTKKCREVFTFAMESEQLESPKYRALLWQLVDAMLWATDALTELMGKSPVEDYLFRAVERCRDKDAAKAPKDLAARGGSAFEIVLALAGPGPFEAGWTTGFVGQRTDSLSASASRTAWLWKVGPAVDAKRLGNAGPLDDLYADIVKALASLGPAVANVQQAFVAKNADQLASAAAGFGSTFYDTTQIVRESGKHVALELGAPFHMLAIFGVICGAFAAYDDAKGAADGSQPIIVPIISISKNGVEVVRLSIETYEKACAYMAQDTAKALDALKQHVWLGRLTVFLSVFSSFIDIFTAPEKFSTWSGLFGGMFIIMGSLNTISSALAPVPGLNYLGIALVVLGWLVDLVVSAGEPNVTNKVALQILDDLEGTRYFGSLRQVPAFIGTSGPGSSASGHRGLKERLEAVDLPRAREGHDVTDALRAAGLPNRVIEVVQSGYKAYRPGEVQAPAWTKDQLGKLGRDKG